MVLRLVGSVDQGVEGATTLAVAALTPIKMSRRCSARVPAGGRRDRDAPRREVASLGFLRALVRRDTKGVVDTRVDEIPVVLVPVAVIETMEDTVAILWAPILEPITLRGISSGIATGVLL